MMNKRVKTYSFFIIVLILNSQSLTLMISSASVFHRVKGDDSVVYRWIWEELEGAPGAINGDDVVFWGDSLGPYHNYTEISSKLVNLNSTFPEFIDLFSIGQTWHGREIWCVKLTNETVTTSKTEYYIVGEHHARELISVENCLYFIDKIIYETGFGLYENLLSSTEIYVIPMLNPDGLSIMHFYPEQRKNLRPIDDDGDNVTDANLDGFLDDELERIYFWNDTTNISEILLEDLDGDLSIAEDLPGGVDLNRNYGAFWNGSGSSPDEIDPLYRGPEAFSENETQALRDFMQQHYFNFALSLHSGIKAIIPPWSYNGSLPSKDEAEFNALMFQLKSLTLLPYWNETAGYLANGVWEDYSYLYHDIICFTLEVYEAVWNGYYFDYFNPSGDGILSNCENVFNALVFMAEGPQLTYSNSLPSIEVTNPRSPNQVFENYTISWSMSDEDEDSLNCSVMVSPDGYDWTVLASNLINETSFFWDVQDFQPGSYYLKVAVSDGKNWITDTGEIRLNVNKEAEGSQFGFWLLAILFGGLATIFIFFNIRKQKGVSKVWSGELHEDEQIEEVEK